MTSTPPATAGTRCLSNVEHGWAWGTVIEPLEDGTYLLELDHKSMAVLPRWYGVTASELSIADDAAWSPCLAAVGAAMPFGRESFVTMVRAAGAIAGDEQLHQFWAAQTGALFGAVPDVAARTLALADAHRLFVRAGFSARELLAKLSASEHPPPDRCRSSYWNQLRMGGRDADEVARVVTVDDARVALGCDAGVDGDALRAIEAFEHAHVALPETLRALWTLPHFVDRVREIHSNNPTCHAVTAQTDLLRGRAPDDALCVRILQLDDFEWWAVFQAGARDARVYTSWDDTSFSLVATSLPFFVWDLAQTGLAWWKRHAARWPIRVTDIGLAR